MTQKDQNPVRRLKMGLAALSLASAAASFAPLAQQATAGMEASGGYLTCQQLGCMGGQYNCASFTYSGVNVMCQMK